MTRPALNQAIILDFYYANRRIPDFEEAWYMIEEVYDANVTNDEITKMVFQAIADAYNVLIEAGEVKINA